MSMLCNVRGWMTAVLIGVPAIPAPAGDWPQVLGPNRDGHAAADETPADAWPAEGPQAAWERPVGSGFAGLAVVGDRAVLFHRIGDEERVEALDTANGETLWEAGYPSSFTPQVGGEDGPLCTPAIHDGKVITFGAQGVLSCYDLASGKRLWSRDTHRDFGALEGYFGAGSSPLIEGDKVIVNVGGRRREAGVVAFSLADGETQWTAAAEDAGYASPIAADIDGTRHVIVVARLNCLSLNPADGAVRFEFPFGLRGPTVNAATPLLMGDRLFLTASYGLGAVFAQVGRASAKTLWADDDLLSSQYSTPVAAGGALYGLHGRQDGPPAALRCIDPEQQRVLWERPGYGYANLIAADGKLLIAGTDGKLTLVRINRNKFEPLASAQVHNGEVRAIPALSGGRLYLRDNDLLKCLSVGATMSEQPNR